MATSSYPPNEYLPLQGILSASASKKNYTRLFGTGSESNYVEFLSADSPNNPASGHAGQLVQCLVQIESPLHFSDDPLPATPTAPPKFPTQPVHRGTTVPILPPGQFAAGDGTVITSSSDANKIVLSGTSKTDATYVLTAEAAVGKGPGRDNTTATWVAARISMTKKSDAPLIFGFGYCPLDKLAGVYLLRANIEAGFVIDFSPLQVQSNGTVTGAATITRDLTYYGYTYMKQTASMDVTQTDPGLYLPADAAFVPDLDRVEYFGYALQANGIQTASLLPPLKQPTPLAALGAVQFVWPVTQDGFTNNSASLVGPALGPLAAAFVSVNEPSFGPLKDAALWLGWFLMQGPGKQDLISALSSEYDYYKNLVDTSAGGSAGGTIKIPIEKPPSASLSPASRAIDGIFDGK